jgi:hypothetical protein
MDAYSGDFLNCDRNKFEYAPYVSKTECEILKEMNEIVFIKRHPPKWIFKIREL